jgi:hypothetical protein
MRAIVAKTLDSLTHYLMNAINRFQLNRVQQLYSINQNSSWKNNLFSYLLFWLNFGF